MDNCFIQVHDGIILNMDLISLITPNTVVGAQGNEKRWTANVFGQSTQITNDEYKTIKKYYESKNLLY